MPHLINLAFTCISKNENKCKQWAIHYLQKNGNSQFRFKDPEIPDSDHKTRTVHMMAPLMKLQSLGVDPKKLANRMLNKYRSSYI